MKRTRVPNPKIRGAVEQAVEVMLRPDPRVPEILLLLLQLAILLQGTSKFRVKTMS